MPQSFVSLPVHLVFSTKNREAIIRDDMQTRFQDEFIALLRKHEIEFDERYLRE